MNTDQRIAVGVDGSGFSTGAGGAHAPCLLAGQDTAAQRAPQGMGMG